MNKHNKASFEELLAERPDLLAFCKTKFDQGNLETWWSLADEADESGFALVEWVESLMVLGEWLDKNGSTLPLKDSVGYVSCAAKSVGNDSSLSHLPSLIQDFLGQYGCERAVKK